MEYGYKTYSYSDIKGWGLILISVPLGILSSSSCVLWKGLKDGMSSLCVSLNLKK